MSGPDPYLDPGPFGRMKVGDLYFLGIIDAIDGANTPEEWAVQKGTSGNFATTVWRGSKLAESIKVSLRLLDTQYGTKSEAVARYWQIVGLFRPKRGKKPTSQSAVNHVLNGPGITRLGLKDPGFLKYNKSNGEWTVDLEFIEYNPSKTAPTGPADPAKPPKEPAPKDALDKQIDEATKELQKP